MTEKTLTLLGFASKAGKLNYGFDSTLTAVKQGKAKIVLCAYDLSPKSLKEITFFADKNSILVLTLKEIDIDTLSKAIGRKCGMIAVKETGFAESLKEEILNDQ